MKTVRDDDGKRYVLLKRAGDASLVRDPETGNACYVKNDRLETVDGESPLRTAAEGIDEPVRRLVGAVPGDRTPGLLIELADRGPTSVRTLLEVDEFCESDLHGVLAECTAAGLLDEVDVDGERGYRATADCRAALDHLREASLSPSQEGSADVGAADSTGDND